MTHRRVALGRRVLVVLLSGARHVGRFREAKSGRVRVEGLGWVQLADVRTLTFAKRRRG